jgi:hypothetical protein
LVSVGYGDIVPVTVEEKTFVIFIALLGAGVFAYSLNSISSIFKTIERKNK